MNSIVPTERAGKTPDNLQLLVFYTDFPAGVRAKQLTDKITLLADRKIFVQFWKLDSIPKIGPLKGIIVQDASVADVVILASSSPAQDDPVISAWLKLLSATKSQRPGRGLLVGVLESEMTTTAEMDQLLSTLFLCACRAQLDFVLHDAGDESRSGWERMAGHFNQMPRATKTLLEAKASPLPPQQWEREPAAAF
jgi:hypothetical protein